MEWLKKLSSAIAYIEENLDKEISYDKAAEFACCSTYYFQRMFSYVAGIPLSDYIRKRRMTQAAFELQRTDHKVLDIALKYGYTSPTSFNRAFQSVHGIPPTAARNEGCLLHAYPAVTFSVTMTGETPMAYRIEQKGPMRIAGIRIPLTENMEKNMERIPAFWKQTMEGPKFREICALADREPRNILGVSTYRDPQNIFYYIAAQTEGPVPEDMLDYTIPAATWVVFESDGSLKEQVQSIFRRFMTEWLPFSGYEYAYLPDVEVYPIYEKQPENGHFQVWIAITKNKEE